VRSRFQFSPFSRPEVDDEWTSSWQIVGPPSPVQASRSAAELQISHRIIKVRTKCQLRSHGRPAASAFGLTQTSGATYLAPFLVSQP
jgi:hypothetical protein